MYSIKEFKGGPLDNYSYVHDKLLTTKSLAATLEAIHRLFRSPYKKSTSEEAMIAAARLVAGTPGTAIDPVALDQELADRYRLALASLILRAWDQRRSVTTRTIQDLDCYTEARPKVDKHGLFDFTPRRCERERECSLAGALKAQPELLRRLRDAIPEASTREEDRRRRRVLKQLINTPKLPLDEEACRSLGDAVFAFFCPDDSVVLTTNMRDHKPLADAIGKRAEEP